MTLMTRGLPRVPFIRLPSGVIGAGVKYRDECPLKAVNVRVKRKRGSRSGWCSGLRAAQIRTRRNLR